MSKHTKGPWKVNKHNHAEGELWLSIGTLERGPVVDIPTGKAFPPRMVYEGQLIAECKYLVTPDEEQWANARLCAAAPDLLDALEQILAHVEDMDLERVKNQCTLCHSYRTLGHAAISKAHGVTTTGKEEA